MQGMLGGDCEVPLHFRYSQPVTLLPHSTEEAEPRRGSATQGHEESDKAC